MARPDTSQDQTTGLHVPGPLPVDGLGLDLVCMTPPFMEALLAGRGRGESEFEGVRIWSDRPDDFGGASVRLTQARAIPELIPWLLYAIVRRSDRRMAGHVGFHSAPGPDYLEDIAPGGLEVGYSVFEPFRRKGYATASVRTLIDWAHREHGVREFVASINHENAASQHVAASLGFKFWREFDPADPDREDIYRLTLGESPAAAPPGASHTGDPVRGEEPRAFWRSSRQ